MCTCAYVCIVVHISTVRASVGVKQRLLLLVLKIQRAKEDEGELCGGCDACLVADEDLRSSPTFRISQSILVSSMLLRPNGHSCLSSRLLFSRTI